MVCLGSFNLKIETQRSCIGPLTSFLNLADRPENLYSLCRILYSLGSKLLPAAQLTLLAMVEVVGGVLWVYLPIFGIHEVPSMLTVIGGIIVLSAILIDGVGVGQPRPLLKIS